LTVHQHPQLRLLSSIALSYAKSVVATDVSIAVTALSFMVGRSSNDALESVQSLVVTGMQSAGPFTVVSGLNNDLNGVSAFGLSSTASLQFFASASCAINAWIISPVSNPSKVLFVFPSPQSSPFVVSVSVNDVSQFQ